MRILSYVLPDGTESYGLAQGDTLRDAGAALRGKARDLQAFLATGGDLAAEAKGETLAAADVTFLPPVPNPDKIICIGLNYMTHIRETGRDAPKHPAIFIRFPGSIVGHQAAMIRPKVSDWFDFEGELAVVIGKTCRHVPAAKAKSVIAGYTCFNDGSVRDWQRHTSQFWAGKSFEKSGSMGPWIVTADEMPEPEAQHMVTRLNGQEMQSTPISDLAFGIPELIAYCSTVCELKPGDVIATGTPSGVGLFREPKVFMKPGDRVEIEITGIGTLSNPIEDEV
ncbi:fumarylacetoacetate hydrolase family protein [Seohaeicola nanhaiensis]|uniref:Fumarylacetoacetate hydrolase family protein n=1 Tax=Seohaeicola nanhaiensis TaxID=1387282 RepID=A0ABV9KLK1_9RHOB